MSASGRGCKPADSILASRKESIGFFAHPPRWVCGTACRAGLTKAHQERSSSVMGRSSILARAAFASSPLVRSGKSSPSLIHLSRTATSESESFLPGGMDGCSSPRTNFISLLPPAFPATAAGPRSPPLRMLSFERKSRPDIFMADPWQAVQLLLITAAAWSGVVCAINEKVKKISPIAFIRAQYPLVCIISELVQ